MCVLYGKKCAIKNEEINFLQNKRKGKKGKKRSELTVHKSLLIFYGRLIPTCRRCGAVYLALNGGKLKLKRKEL